MRYRILGTTGLRVSVVGIGTWQFGGEWGKAFEQDEVDAMFRRGAELGCNLIDTAECYGDHLSEQFIGRAIEGQRDKWVLATKFGHKFHEPFNRDTVLDPDGVRAQLEGSLRALRTDRIDLYQFHSGPDELFDNHELWSMLEAQVQAGKILHLGISIGSNDNLHQTERATRVGAGAIQVVYNRLDRAPEQRVFPSCVEQNLGVLARVPLASGYLSGKYPADAAFDKNDVRGMWQKDDDRRAMIERALQVKQAEVPEGVPMAQWALAWCLQHDAVTCVIPGCKSVEQVQSNCEAADLDTVRDDHPQAA